MAKISAVVLAAGQGKRMNSPVAKQYLLLKGKPVLYYTLRAFEECPFIDEIVVTAGADDLTYCQREIVDKYQFRKVKKIVPGGKERFHSVYRGLLAAEECDYIYIHDGARPFVTQEILRRTQADVEAFGACAVGMPVKDTIRISDGKGFGLSAPDRSLAWQMQTPQAFAYPLVLAAYKKLMEKLQSGPKCSITDDAMVVETMMGRKVRLTEGAYTNLKITTPEDLKTAEAFLEERSC